VDLYDNGIAWTIPSTAVIDVAYQKPDGTKGIYSKLPDGTKATTFSGNVLSATIAPQMVTCAGTIRAAFVFSNGGDETLATFPFTITVEANPAAGAERSEDYFNPKDISDLRAEVAAHAGRKDNPHGVTPAQIGAATEQDMLKALRIVPNITITKGNNWDDATDTGIYLTNLYAGSGGANYPPVNDTGWLFVYGSEELLYHDWYTAYSGKIQRIRRNGTWSPWEFETPNMANDVEYRTTERWSGKAVYVKQVYLGLMPNTANLRPMLVDSGVTGFLSGELRLNSGGWYEGSQTNGISWQWIFTSSNGTVEALINTSKDMSGYQGRAVIKYTKD
jgi:hypothetical protein